MILAGPKVELIPMLGWDDWEYAFELARAINPRLDSKAMVREALKDGFQFYVGYAKGQRAGVVFSKHYRDGLTLDGYTDPKILEVARSAWYSLEAAHLLMMHLHNFTDMVYARMRREDTKLHRLCKVMGLHYDHEDKEFIVYSHQRVIQETYVWDRSRSFSESYQKS